MRRISTRLAISFLLVALLPAWALEGSHADVVARLKDPGQRPRIRAAVVEALTLDRGAGDPRNVVVAACAWKPGLAGRNLAEITRERGADPTFEAAAETAMWIVEQGGAAGVFHAISEEDLVRILQHRATMIASDGEVPVFGVAAPHPRSYGTFVRVLGRYVRERRVLTLPDAAPQASTSSRKKPAVSTLRSTSHCAKDRTSSRTRSPTSARTAAASRCPSSPSPRRA